MRKLPVGTSNRKKAVSAVIGGLILFAMIFSIAFTYLYTVTQDQNIYQSKVKQSAIDSSAAGEESLYITGILVSGMLSFIVNNTGIPVVLTSYIVTDQGGQVDAFSSGNPSKATACALVGGTIPCSLNQGSSTTINTNLGYAVGDYYVIKILTSRGSSFTGTYPAVQLTSTSVSAIVASGLGSVVMKFDSYTFYPYAGTGSGNWKVNLTSPLNAAITPFGQPIVMAIQVTNYDPSAGTIVLDSHSDLWTFVSCGIGCGSQSILFFFIMNVSPTGNITSQTTGSYVPITIPFGATTTLYFGSEYDLSLNSYNYQQINDAPGEHDVFLILSGTKVTAAGASGYSQNLPFAATFTADNIAAFEQNIYSCSSGGSETFQLNITNSKFSSYNVNELTINTNGFSAISYPVPVGWTVSYASGTITYTATSGGIAPGITDSFTWSGKAPTVTTGTEYTFPSYVYYPNGNIRSQSVTTGCYVS